MRLSELISRNKEWSWVDRRMYILANVLFAVAWLFFMVRLARQWQGMGGGSHDLAWNLALGSLALWIAMVSEKNSGLCLLIALGVCEIAFQAV
jgi:hypothetical protein